MASQGDTVGINKSEKTANSSESQKCLNYRIVYTPNELIQEARKLMVQLKAEQDAGTNLVVR